MTVPALSFSALLFLEVAAFVALCMQIVQTTIAVSMRPRVQRLTTVVFGACAMVHLAIASGTVVMIDWQTTSSLASAIEAAGLLPLLWTNAALAAICAMAAHLRREPLLWVMATLMLATTPPVVEELGAGYGLVALADICGFLGIEAYQLRQGIRRRHEGPTNASVAEAMNAITVGMLVTDGRGGSVFMNDAMRSQLEEQGLPTDLGNLSHIWERMQAYAVTLDELGVRMDALSSSAPSTNENQTLLQTRDGRILSARIEHPHGELSGDRVFSLDVTKLVDAARRLSSANDALERANAKLQDELADVRAIAQQAAFLRMRVAVHDVIGQRLSILQRYLDEGTVDEGSMGQLHSLMDSILEDLRTMSGAMPVEHLEDVVDAFALVDVRIVVTGTLPHNLAVSNALVRIVREASTNACQHARARCVFVTLGTEERGGRTWSTVEVHDDGMPQDVSHKGAAGTEAPVHEGTGIPGMRRAAEELGGTFSVSGKPRFCVAARIPLPQDGDDGNADMLPGEPGQREGTSC